MDAALVTLGVPIDQLYASPVWKPLAVQRLPRAGSDHYGVLVTLARDTPRLAPARTPGSIASVGIRVTNL